MIIPSKFYYRDIPAQQQLEKFIHTTSQVISDFLVLQGEAIFLTIKLQRLSVFRVFLEPEAPWSI
jgi:hypothetical protein